MEEHQTPHKRRVRYKGKYPKKFEEKYKELQPEKYQDMAEHVIRKGKTPAGMHISIMVDEILNFLNIQPGETGFDAAVADMEVGQVVDIHLMPEEAYGMPNSDAIFTLEITHLPGSEELREYGIEPQSCGKGVTGLTGKGGRYYCFSARIWTYWLCRRRADWLSRPRIQTRLTAVVMICMRLCC